MNKSMNNKGSSLSKNLKHSNSLVLQNITAEVNMVLPTTEPLNPVHGSIYLDLANNELKIYTHSAASGDHWVLFDLN